MSITVLELSQLVPVFGASW